MPYAAAINWKGLAEFLGVSVDEVKSMKLKSERKDYTGMSKEEIGAISKEDAIILLKSDLKKIYGVEAVGENEENILVFIRKESVTDMLPLTICGKPVKAIVTGKVIAGSVIKNANELLTEEYVQNELDKFILDKDRSKECQCDCHSGRAIHCMPCECYEGRPVINKPEDMGEVENAFYSVKNYQPSERSIKMTPESEKALTLNQPLPSGKK